MGYRGILRDEYLEGLPAIMRGNMTFSVLIPRKPHTIVGVENDRVVGLATMCSARDSDV